MLSGRSCAAAGLRMPISADSHDSIDIAGIDVPVVPILRKVFTVL